MVKKLVGWIYTIKNKINGKLYVGRTNNYQRRYNEHFGKFDTCTILRKAFEKYGKENFEMKPVVSFNASNSQVLDEILNLLEKYYIEKFNTYKNGYNATLGGEGNSGWKISEETRKRRSKSLKGRNVSEKEKLRLLSYVKNRVWTKEQKEHQRQIMLNRDHTIYEKAASKLRGKKRNQEVIMSGAIKRRKPILQYSLDGVFIKEYAGASLIEGYDNANIIACCKNKLNNAYGFVWRYKQGKTIPLKIKVSAQMHIKNRPVQQFTKEGNFVAEYCCVNEVIENTKVNRSALSNCLAGLSKTCGGYIWKYKERKEVING